MRGRNSSGCRHVGLSVTTQPELSPTDWVREQTERILAQGTTDGVEILDRAVVLFTTTGAQSHQFHLPNVLFVGRKMQAIENVLRQPRW